MDIAQAAEQIVGKHLGIAAATVNRAGLKGDQASIALLEGRCNGLEFALGVVARKLNELASALNVDLAVEDDEPGA